jgi:FtsP/CotA-like multicopper oxidase with cupredoxin domain
MISRRTFIKRTAQAGIVAAAGTELVSLFAKTSAKQNPLVLQPLQIPAIISGGDLALAPGTYKIYPGIDTNVLMINNSFIAPTIKVKKGDTFTAKVHNNLTEDSLLHWHGVHAPSVMAGHPKNAVAPGASYDVSFPIIQRASTNFYHAHPDMNTGKEVYMGIAGFYIIEDDDEKALGLPAGDYDIPLMIQDKRFDANKQLIYAPNNLDMLSGWLGDTILVNGTPNAFLDIAPTLYRFRLVNASNARFYKIALSDGKNFTLIGNDGGFLDKPVTVANAMIGPAERIDILIDFSSYLQGQNVTLKSLPFSFSDGPGSGSVAQGADLDLMQFQISKTASSGGVIPAQLPAIVKYQITDVKRTREWSFAAEHHINDQPFYINRIDGTVPFGDLEQWTFTSEGENTHPIHVHGGQFQVIDRGAGNPLEPTDAGWKDVVRLDPLGTVNVLIKFSEYTGLFLIHCHKLEHADMGMMANFEVDDAGNVNDKKQAGQSIAITPNPATDFALLTYPILQNDETLMIIDDKGAMIVKELLSAGSDRYAITTAHLASGSYKIILGDERVNLVVTK